MKNRRRKIMTAVVVTAGILLMAGCGVKDTAAQEASAEKPVDAVSSASQVFYKDSSLDREQLWAAIEARKGGCTIATVNEDGTPNLIVAVPGTAGEEHIYFTWADNVSKSNARRTGNAMAGYYIYNPDAESKEERNIGARLRLELEQDEEILEKLAESDPAVKAGTVFTVAEILPLG